MAKDPGSRRLLFLGLGLILLVGVGGVMLAWLTGPAAGSRSPGLTGGGDTARQAFAPAAVLAAQWQEDARLASVSGQRLRVGMQPEGEIQWSFQFFSPSTQRLALIVVEDGAARVMRDSLSPYRVSTFSADEWRVDSDQAQQTWWERGGSSMAAKRPDVDLVMQLRVPGEGEGHPVWTVAGVVADANSAFTVMVDAADGALVGP